MARDADAIVVDRHIVSLLFESKRDTPTKAQIAKAKKVIREIAANIGWAPREVKAALWAADIRRKGEEHSLMANTSDDSKRKGRSKKGSESITELMEQVIQLREREEIEALILLECQRRIKMPDGEKPKT